MRAKKRLGKLTGAVLLALLLALTLVLVGGLPVMAQDEVTTDKTVSETEIECDGSATVTLTVNAKPDEGGHPEDIMLVLDRSGSMAGQPIVDLMAAAKAFVDIIDEGTDGLLDGVIGGGSRVGMVSFADSATLDQPLTTDATAVKTAIDTLVASGLTNHEAAFQTAQAELAGSIPTNSKDLIIFTDGETTTGGDPNDDAAAARAAETIIFAIGLGGVNVANLNEWATDPDDEHVYIAPTSGDLEEIFKAIGVKIIIPGATNIVIVDTVNPDFFVTNVSASKGSVVQVGNVLTWTIDELAGTATLTYTITHDDTKPGGMKKVNISVTYTDDEGHVVTFPDPMINVLCPVGVGGVMDFYSGGSSSSSGMLYGIIAGCAAALAFAMIAVRSARRRWARR